MTDGDVVRLARRIDSYLWKIRDLCNEIAVSEHPNAEAIYDALVDNMIDNPAWATHVVSDELKYPERWETGDFGIRFKQSGGNNELARLPTADKRVQHRPRSLAISGTQ